MEQDLYKRAKLRCMHLLEKRDYTEKQLRDKLRISKSAYTEDMIDQALAYVKSFHYVDDARYASQYVECMRLKKSRRQIEQELFQKGVSRECIEQAMEECREIGEEEQILAWMEKKHYDPETADRKETQRMYAFLMRRGFPGSEISRLLKTGSYE